MKSTYEYGMDVLGDGVGIGDFVPWLGLASKVAGGLLGGGGGGASSDDKVKASAAAAAAQKKAEEARKKAEDAEAARKKAEEAAAKAKTTLYLVLGGVGFVTMGGVLYIALRKR